MAFWCFFRGLFRGLLRCFSQGVLLGVIFLSFAAQAAPDRVTITGSSTIAPLASELARAFEKKMGPDRVRIDVQTGGSSRGLSDALNGRSDIGMVSRHMSPTGKLQVFPVARDGIGLIVHKDNPLSSLTKKQLKDIYLGKTTNWRQVGGPDLDIVVVHKAAGRSTQELFLGFLGLKNRQIKASVIVGDNQQGIKTVSGIRGAVGYVSIGSAASAAQSSQSLKVLAMDGIAATQQNVRSGTYPLLRILNFVTHGDPQGFPKGFLAFSQSKEANKVIEKQSFVPMGG